MFAATVEERNHDETSQTSAKHNTMPRSKVKKKAHPAMASGTSSLTLPPLFLEPPSFSAGFVCKPLSGCTPIPQNHRSDTPLSVVELPRLIAKVGPERAINNAKWLEGPRLMASALGTDIPVKTNEVSVKESAVQSLADKDDSKKIPCKDKKIKTGKDGKGAKQSKDPLTGTEVVEIFAERQHLGEIEFYYLKEAGGDHYRPYDLRVVHPSKAGSEHYIFSPCTVLHVTERGYGGLVTLEEWHRESLLWTALQNIPFFRNYRVRKAFIRWHMNVRRIVFQHRCKNLQDVLLIAVPQFRNALLLFTRLIEELKGMHWLPQDESRTYTLLEFKSVLKSNNQECVRIFEKLIQYRTAILNEVREQSYTAHQELQLCTDSSKKTDEYNQPIHLQLAHQQGLRKELARAEGALQKLGNLAALINQMTVQSLVMITQQDVTSFLNHVMKRGKPQQCCLFQTKLIFSADGHLTLDPPVHLFQGVVSEAIRTVGDSAIQMSDSCGLFLDTNNSGASSTFISGSVQDLTPDLSLTTGQSKDDDEMTGVRGFFCRGQLRDQSARWLVFPKLTPLKLQGRRLQGCYYPLDKSQLEWQMSINDMSKQVEEEQAKMMQEAQSEIQHLCDEYMWLVDIHSFTAQWSSASLESIKGQPALFYEEHIKKLRHWIERIHTLPPSVSACNQLFSINCSHIQDDLGRRLKFIEEEVLKQLVEQMKRHSESLISQMKKATSELKTEPLHFRDFAKYASKVRHGEKILADTQHHLEYVRSLRHTICINYRSMTEQEVTLEEQMLSLWDCYGPVLKQAEDIVCQCLPSAAETVDRMCLSLVCALDKVVSNATSGPFLDPAQNANEMFSKLNIMCKQVHAVSAKLKELSATSENLRGDPLDLTVVTIAIQKIEARKELWKLKTQYSTWIYEWRQLVFSKFVVSQAQEKVDMWQQQAISLTRTIPTHDAVLQETLSMLESFSCHLAVMDKLWSPTLKYKHRRTIFQDMGLIYVPEMTLTVAELMSKQLVNYEKQINKMCREAEAERDMEEAFRKLQQEWEARLFQLDKFTVSVWHGSALTQKPSDDTVSNHQTASQHSSGGATLTVSGLEMLLVETEDSLMTLKNMMISPYSSEFRSEVENWMQLLQELDKLLDLFERCQQTWIFLVKMFDETSISSQMVELVERFNPVSETFKEIIHSISIDPYVLNFVHSKRTDDQFHGKSLSLILINSLSTMEAISSQMMYFLDAPRCEFPRLCFLSDKEVIKLLATHPTPSALLPFVRKCFKGVRWFEVDNEMPNDTTNLNRYGSTSNTHFQMKVLGVFGSFNEHITFLCPLESNVNSLVWLSVLEKELQKTMIQLMKQCGADAKGRGDVLPMLNLLSEYPLQCVLVAEEVAWHSAVLKVYHASSPVRWSHFKTCISAKLKNLCQSIRDTIKGISSKSVVSNRMMMCLRALVQLTMKHAQQLSRLMKIQSDLESSFEWLSLMKYHINLDIQSLNVSDHPACYVDILGYQLPYGYEYLGPEDWNMTNTPTTDRAILGILLALTSYRCGFVSGPCMSGKRKTVVQLGRALGRQVVILKCCTSLNPGVLQQMLFGALQTGAWLILDSVDLLAQGVLSLLGQHLADIHQSFSLLKNNKEQRLHVESKNRASDAFKDCRNSADPDYQIVLAGKSISANLSYGCVIISSKGHAADVPESLRAATRPIALTHPDYKIIAEVMLASFGFSDAMFLGRRLVSLFSLAKDSLCLPEFISEAQNSWLVVLKNVITIASIYLQQIIWQQEVLVEDEVLAEEHKDPRSPPTVSDKVPERDDDKVAKPSRSMHSSKCNSIIQGIMEEKAIIKSVLYVILPAIREPKKASLFHTIFKETFPLASQFPSLQQYIEEEEQNLLKDAVTEELKKTGFHSDTQIICSALTLYQAFKFSQAVLLIGPSGSGKTTCYRALAGAVCSLAARATEDVFDHDSTTKGDTPQKEPHIIISTWSSVDTLVIFPNAMSHEEVFGGFCKERGWQDGTITKVLKNSERCRNKSKNKTPKERWLVMDGEPLGQPGWLDHFTTLCCPEGSSLCLSSGKRPFQSELKLLVEITDLSDASPSAVSRCNLVYFTGNDLWKSVWRSEMEALSSEHTVNPETLKMWSRLAEDLFCRTLSLLSHNALISAVHIDVYGLQEIMSFIRILNALLEHFGKEEAEATLKPADKTDMPQHGAHMPDTAAKIASTQQELQARNIFLVAYIWGFGGHLHPRHWPQFDVLARQLLSDSRDRVEIPGEGTVFEHFFNISDMHFSRSKNTQWANPKIPKYEKYSYLLDLMLEANQPVLLAGEAGSGKTTLCKSLLSYQRPHITLPVSRLLNSQVLRSVLDNLGCWRSCQPAMDARNKPLSLFLFVDDLHEAPCDVFGKTSEALETLRQSISKGGILTFNTYHFKLLNSGNISYMATCRTFGLSNHSNNVISSRLSRLFSIFVLPSVSAEVLFSMHSPWLKLWLKKIPFVPNYVDMASCIISATQHLYHAVCEQFQPTFQRPHFVFSHHDLQKVFQGMCLWQPHNQNTQLLQENASPTTNLSKPAVTGFSPAKPQPAASVLKIAHLWMHECLRTFGDRLCSQDESTTLVSLITKVSITYYGSKLVGNPQPVNLEGPPMTFSLPTETADTPKPTSESPGTPNRELSCGPSPSHLSTKNAVPLTSPKEEEEYSRMSDRPNSSGSSPFSSPISTPENEDTRSVKNEVKTVVNNNKLTLQDVSSCRVLPPSPPKEPKPGSWSEWKRDHKLTEPSLQTDGSPVLPSQLLQHTGETMDMLVYGPELSESVTSMDEQHNFKCSSNYEEQDLDLLVRQLSATVNQKGEDIETDDNYNITFSYIVHRQRMCQLLHILRALLIPGGHGVLFGSARGTGRKTTVRLAASLMGYQLMEIHPGNENKLHEILKEAGTQTRVKGTNVIILAHEKISQSVREELLVAMAHRTCPGLYSDDELTSFIPKINALRNSRRPHMDNQILEKYLSHFHRNVHVFLLLPLTMSDSTDIPDKNTLGWNAHITKALSLSCCVEVYQAWSRQSLMEAAAHCFNTNHHKPESDSQNGLEASLALAMACIHQSACRYASVILRAEPFSPETYMEFIALFFYLFNHLHKQGLSEANRVAAVLARLDVMTNTAAQYKQDCKQLQETVADTQQCKEELLKAVDAERRFLEEARQNCVIEENKLNELEERICHSQHQVTTLFLSGLKILECLSAADLEEVRHYRDPPDGVVKIMDAICLLFNHPPSWESAKQLLGQSNLLQEFEFFDRHRLTNHQLQQLGQIIDSPQFVPESVREVSKACESLCRWVRAVYECSCLERYMFSREASKEHLEAQAVDVRSSLHFARLQEELVGQLLEDKKLQLQFVQEMLEELLINLHRAESLDRQADVAVSQMKRHITDWKAAAKEAELNNQTAPGDALILAASIAYLGPFGPDIRTELLHKWRVLCQTGSINMNPEDPRTSLFTDSEPAPPDCPPSVSIPVAEKLQSAMARAVGVDQWQVQDINARVVVKLLLWGYRSPCVQRWPLLANAQHHAVLSSQSWLITGRNTKLGNETDYGVVVCADDPELLDKLDQAAEIGLRVLVTHVERAVPSPQFLSRLVCPSASFLPEFIQPVQPTHPEFCLFLSTHLPVQLLNSEIHPSILAQVRVVDLSLSSAEIQELMLTQLLQAECMELLIQHSLVQNDKQLLQDKLVKEEASLMDYIHQSITPLLQDSDFLPRVVVCQETMKNLEDGIQLLNVELEHQKAWLAGFSGVAKLAADLYQALEEVARVSPVYFFSLSGFIAVMRTAFFVQCRPDMSCIRLKVPDCIISEITHRMITTLLAQYRPCLFQNHATLLKLRVSVALLQYNKLCSEAERMAFLRGLQDIDFPLFEVRPYSPSPTIPHPVTSQHALPSWISPHVHPELLCLEKIPAFRGLIASLATSPEQWQEYLRFPSSTVAGSVPCCSHSHLSLLQRAILWKTMVPDCLEGVAEAMAACHLGLSGQTAGPEVPHMGNPEALSQLLVRHEGPIIITLPSPGTEKWTSIQPFHLIQQLTHYHTDTKGFQVKVISFGATFENEVILSALDSAVEEGHWLVFNNCHLLEQWDDKVLFHLNRLTSSSKAAPCTSIQVHPRFRLWFITRGYTPRSIPVAVRMCALPLVCDSPWDVKEELSCSLQQVVSLFQSESLLDVMSDDMEPLLRCAILHSVLLQRQRYMFLGQGNIYRWTQEDLLTLVDAHIRIVSLCHNKTKALEYIAVNLVHGGHVSDSADMEVMKSVAEVCLSALSHLWGSGPHVLSDVISNPGHLDLSGLLQVLKHRVQGLGDISDPLVLGFSASLAAKIVKINGHLLNMLLQDSQSPLGKVRRSSSELKHPATLPDYCQARERLQALKSFLAHKNESALVNAGADSHGPLRDFLLAEWDDLIDLVSSLLSQLHQPMECTTPAFTSLLRLTNLSRLERSAELLSAYLSDDTTTDPPAAYRLSAFRNARGFLVAVKREAARVKHRYLSDIALHFQVLNGVTLPASPSPSCVYLCGLELRGALWDTQLGALQDTLSPLPCSLPLLCVRAHAMSTDTSWCKTSRLKNADTLKDSGPPPSSDPELPVYQCPLYLDGEWESGDWGLADANIITRVPLLAKINLALCSLRRVRLVSTL
ncbi:dynein heavy chain domain-containing protein 1 [Myripristis murdjan]|uniref:dynein heavy chain domain-containing protein 1 n=1 Tax=Myripristis murdjan TaxID=586833 RepID=UPI001175FFFD|nr:dynein heavy chain domain-containing protein 1-like [Myripristis murdjan]